VFESVLGGAEAGQVGEKSRTSDAAGSLRLPNGQRTRDGLPGHGRRHRAGRPGVTATAPQEPRSTLQRARELADKLPTKWLITSVSATVLALSALVGGLEDAPVAAVPAIDAGSAHVGSELTVSIGQALLIDAFPEQGIVPDDGNRLLVVRATVENTTNEPRRLGTVDADSVGLAGVPGLAAGEPPRTVAVIEDGSSNTVVQPGVPVELAYIWEVAGDAVAAGDPVTVDLLDRDFISEGRLTYGGLYGDPIVTATVELALDDVGAGVGE
jgi:hypothetical protein